MKLCALLILLCLGAALPAALREPALSKAVTTTAKVGEGRVEGAQAPAAPVVESAPSNGRLSVRLKDGQAMNGLLQKSDKYFLSVNNEQGTHFDIPWTEVEAVESTDAGVDLATLRGNLTPGATTVMSLIQARNGSQALKQAFWPGMLLHGAGHRYAGDNDTFVSLAGGELFGVVVGGFGLSELLGETKAGEHKDTALALSIGGGAIFALTWLYDLAFAPGAARDYNKLKGLSLEPRLNGVQLAYKF